jgi:regulator of sigma E protease
MLSNFFTDGLVVIIVLGVMIFVHELGHFLAAKWFGVRVLVFSLGFGHRLFGFRKGDTDYRVSLLPLGGYVKMAGDDPSKPLAGEPGEFLARPRWQRFIVAIMGPAMNILMALTLLAGLYKFHFQKPAYMEQPARIGDVEPNSPAGRAGLKPADTIVSLGGARNPKWEDIAIKILTSPGETIPLEVLRDGQTLSLSLTPKADGRDQVGDAGWFPYVPATIASVDPGLPAGKAGLKPGDQIVGVDGRTILCWPRLAYLIRRGNGRPMNFSMRREGREFQVQLQPVYAVAAGEKLAWRIGVGFQSDVVVRRLPWEQAIAASLEDSFRNSMVTFDALQKILTRRMSPRSLSGPIGIAQMSGEAYRAGLSELLMLVSFISLQLGIFNLLPIPILDGGVILLLLIEGAIRRDLSLEFKERVVQVGLVLLLLLAVVVMYNDIIKAIKPY